MEPSSSPKIFAIGLIGGLGVAAALGAAFVLGSQAGGAKSDPQAQVLTTAVSPTAPAGEATEGMQPGPQIDPEDHEGHAPTGNAEAGGGGPAVAPTATPEPAEPSVEPTATPTSAPEPGGGCPFCIDPGILIPLPTEEPDPCPYCPDIDLVSPIEVVPPTGIELVGY